MKKMKPSILLLLLLFVFAGCKKETIDVSYDAIVDSSFTCEATINGEYFSFPFHDRPAFSAETYSDSILIEANLNFREEADNYLANMLTISISKKFKISELTYSYVEYGTVHSSGDLTQEEYGSIFHKGKYPFSYTNCKYNTCVKSQGASIYLQSYRGSIYETDYLNNFVEAGQVGTFYQHADFELTSVEKLAPGAVVLEGNLKADVYSFYGELIPVEAHFKAYNNNILRPPTGYQP